MAYIEQAFTNLVIGDADVAAAAPGGIWPFPLPWDQINGGEVPLPALTYQRVAGPRHHIIPVAFPTIQITAWADTYPEAKVLADKVRRAVQGFCGVQNSVKIPQIVHENDLDVRDPETGRYTVPQDFKVIAWEE